MRSLLIGLCLMSLFLAAANASPAVSSWQDDYQPSRLLLVVQVNEERQLALNANSEGTMDDLSVLRAKLQQIFDERLRLAVIKPGTAEIEKTVYVVIPSYLKKDEAANLIREVGAAGASPVLELTPQQFELSSLSGKPQPKTRQPISAGVLNGKAVSLPKPYFSNTAAAAKATGAVTVEITVDESGTVIAARALTGSPETRAVVVEAARQAKFRPVSLSGQPVRFRGVVSYQLGPE
ncbi:MAG TPA: TonB family protein [Pyrinomonadaceae bacterium]